MTAAMELALGTVQFGMKYGIAGRGAAVPESEVKEILAAAWQGGIRTLDTASAYGDIEERLQRLAQGRPFSIVAKIPAAAAATGAADVAEHVRKSIATIRARLGESVCAVLFHRAADLSDPGGDTAWSTAAESLAGTDLKLGASCYSPVELRELRARFPIAVAQVPGNALDQRLLAAEGSEYPEVHLRSAFLQGLLLMPEQQAAVRVPKAKAALLAWHRWCRERALDPLQAALSIVKAMPAVSRCVVGVDSVAQLQEIVTAWNDAESTRAPELAVQDQDVIDPRRW
jgi:aryl-alcohol dehydrogenase-like predicted oxidoreductase